MTGVLPERRVIRKEMENFGCSESLNTVRKRLTGLHIAEVSEPLRERELACDGWLVSMLSRSTADRTVEGQHSQRKNSHALEHFARL